MTNNKENIGANLTSKNILVQNNLFSLVGREIVKNELSAANQQQAFGITILLLVLIISPVIIFLVLTVKSNRSQMCGYATCLQVVHA